MESEIIMLDGCSSEVTNYVLIDVMRLNYLYYWWRRHLDNVFPTSWKSVNGVLLHKLNRVVYKTALSFVE